MKRLLCILTVSVAVRADTILFEKITDRVGQKVVKVDPGKFGQAYVENLSRSQLGRATRPFFLQLLMYGTKGGPPLPKPDHISFDYWKRQYLASIGSPDELAELIVIGKNAVLRVRDEAGKPVAKVLSGTNPLIFTIGENTFEIIYIEFRNSLGFGRQIDVYVRTPATLAKDLGMPLLRRLLPLFPNLNVSIFVRNDAWFVFEPGYPFSNPLILQGEPPIADEYNQTRTLVCGPSNNLASCRFE